MSSAPANARYFHLTPWNVADLVGRVLKTYWEESTYWSLQKDVEALAYKFSIKHSLDRPVALSSAQAQLEKELIFERIRSEEFPTLPSRLNSMFLWENEAAAREDQSSRAPTSWLLEIEPVGHAKVHVAHQAWLNCNARLHLADERARCYWSGGDDEGGPIEVLLRGAFRIVQIVAAPRESIPSLIDRVVRWATDGDPSAARDGVLFMWLCDVAGTILALGVQARGTIMRVGDQWISALPKGSSCERLNAVVKQAMVIARTRIADPELEQLVKPSSVDCLGRAAQALTDAAVCVMSNSEFESLIDPTRTLLEALAAIAAEYELRDPNQNVMPPEAGEVPVVAWPLAGPPVRRVGIEVRAAIQHCVDLAVQRGL